jgi:hypothetical protein
VRLHAYLFRVVASLFAAGLIAGDFGQIANSQSPGVSAQPVASRPLPSEDLPGGLIDSGPILAYFDDTPMPDTVRGLLGELNRADTCGTGAELQTREACALIFYRLDPGVEPDRLRPPLIIKAVYRVTQPEDLADTVIQMPEGSGELKSYTDEDLFEPLRNIRANICLRDKRTPDECKATGSKGVLYHPFGILGKQENDRENILPAKSAKRHFELNLKLGDPEGDKEWLLRNLCEQHITCR